MTTPKDTWISVNDANIPSKIPKNFFLLLRFKYKNKRRLSYYDNSYKVNLSKERVLYYDNSDKVNVSKVNWIEPPTFWKLLPKPKTTN